MAARIVLDAVIAVLVIAVLALAIKAASRKKRLSGNGPDVQTGRLGYNGLLHRQQTAAVDDELARLKREMGG